MRLLVRPNGLSLHPVSPVLTVFAALLVCIAPLCVAQKTSESPQARPLQAVPYTPSLDLASMDRSADPCVDFYRYSCGGWKKNNPIPPDQAAWSVYGKLASENEQFLWGILLDMETAKHRTPNQQKIGDYFAACMDTQAIDKLGDSPLQPDLQRISALAGPADLTAFVANEPVNLFFRAGSAQDPGNAEQVIATIGAGGLGLPDRDYYTKTDAKSVEIRQHYAAYITHILTLAGERPQQAKQDAAAILAFETTLAKSSLTRVERRNPYNEYHKMTVDQLQALDGSFRWAEYFRAVGLQDVATLNVRQPEFFKALDAQMRAEPRDMLKAYLRFHLVSAYAPYLSNNFVTAHFDFYSKYLRGVPEMRPRWRQCVNQVDENLGEALGQEFVRRTFSPQTKQKTQRMTDQIEQAMAQEIEQLSWMSAPTKQEALVKLHEIRNKIGYPSKWRDYSTLQITRNDYFADVKRSLVFEKKRRWAKVGKPVDRAEWGMTPPTVNAYYNPQMNDINFPAGVLQPPLYDPKMDDAPNYGDTGSTIGHELTHGFDDEGRQFDGQGNLKDWWSKQDAANFNQRLQCVRNQYANYIIVDDIHINSKLTSGEDVADLGGTLLAYIAWKAQTANMHLQPEQGLTPDQRFFVGMAQWACENERPEDERARAITDPHSPAKYRVNGVVANLPEFRRAFSCKKGQPMVNADSCKIW